jgi:hypothetical protein
MVDELAKRDRRDLLELGLYCASLVLEDKVDKHWFRERFHDMLQGIIEDSWLYQEVMEKRIEKGVEKGVKLGIEQDLQQGLQQGLQRSRRMLIQRTQKRFPALAPLAEEQADRLQDADVLDTVINAIIDAETVEEARRILEGCTPD